ncbi:MAG: histidine phosphatase family protein [Acidimicrobiales bacterium]
MVEVDSLDPALLRDVIVIRHSQPLVERDRLPVQWRLSLRGSEASYELGACFAPTGLRRIVTNPEKKARETAAVLSQVLGVGVVADDRLREVQRPWTDGDCEELVVRYLEGERIEGWEPVEHVLSRWLDFFVSYPREGPIGVVTHGTAMACLLLSGDTAKRARF